MPHIFVQGHACQSGRSAWTVTSVANPAVILCLALVACVAATLENLMVCVNLTAVNFHRLGWVECRRVVGVVVVENEMRHGSKEYNIHAFVCDYLDVLIQAPSIRYYVIHSSIFTFVECILQRPHFVSCSI